MSAISHAQFERSFRTAYTTDLDNLAKEWALIVDGDLVSFRHGGHDKPSRSFKFLPAPKCQRQEDQSSSKADPRRHRYGSSGHCVNGCRKVRCAFPIIGKRGRCEAKKSPTSTLRGLERDDRVSSVTAQVPIRVDYEAPALGHELIVKFQPIRSWCGKGSSVHGCTTGFDEIHRSST